MKYIEPNSERWLSLDDLPSEEWKPINGYEELYSDGYISQCCSGKYKQAYGYVWKYADEEEKYE